MTKPKKSKDEISEKLNKLKLIEDFVDLVLSSDKYDPLASLKYIQSMIKGESHHAKFK
jgi:hypothetical protein